MFESMERNQIDRRGVEAGGQHPHRGQRADFAALEGGDDGIALLLRRVAKDCAADDALVAELLGRTGQSLAAQQEALEAEQSAARKSQVKSVDRSERIRTYNFPENRIADHRTGYKSYNLDAVMDGALEPVIQSAIQMDEEARLAAIGEAK